MSRKESPYYGEEGLMDIPEGKRKFMARRLAQKRVNKDVYDRRKEFFRTLHAEEGAADASASGRSGVSDNDRSKARRVRERSDRK